jgi:hypothetical protein
MTAIQRDVACAAARHRSGCERHRTLLAALVELVDDHGHLDAALDGAR